MYVCISLSLSIYIYIYIYILFIIYLLCAYRAAEALVAAAAVDAPARSSSFFRQPGSLGASGCLDFHAGAPRPPRDTRADAERCRFWKREREDEQKGRMAIWSLVSAIPPHFFRILTTSIA